MINKDINIKVLSNSMVILNDKTVLGITGENLQGKIIFNFEEFVDGVAWLEIEKENGEKGYIQMTKENETYTLEIKSSLLNTSGYLYMQLRITQDENVSGIPVFKSKKFYVEVLNAINATATIEDDYPNIIDIVNNKLGVDDILAGENITIEKSGKKVTINSVAGGSRGVSKKYIDEQDTKTLENAKEYTDKQVPSAVETYVNEHKEELKGSKGEKGADGKNYSVEIVESTSSTQEIQPNRFYKFGEVSSLNITLAAITDTSVLNEYMFEFASGSTATTLTLPNAIKWLETPSIEANKIYQCSIVDNVGVLLGVSNV